MAGAVNQVFNYTNVSGSGVTGSVTLRGGTYLATWTSDTWGCCALCISANGVWTPVVTGTTNCADVIALAAGNYQFTYTGMLNGAMGLTEQPRTPHGPPGPRGLAGAAGDGGVAGPKGDSGPRGAQGPQGIGATGPQGIAGAKGDTGAQGPQGIAGARGDTGAQGPQGIAGARGDAGAQGPQGIAGAKGDSGAQGPQGIAGARGDAGQQGIAGSPASLYSDPGYSYQTPADNFVLTMISGLNILNPAGALSRGTLNFPTTVDGAIVRFVCTVPIAGLVMAAGFNTVKNGLTKLQAGEFATFIYRSASSAWFRIG